MNLVTDDGNILTLRVRSYRTATLTSLAAMSVNIFSVGACPRSAELTACVPFL